ncbi:unnamed protein product [Mytilus coruscus]|uniref:Uncharacterized protein n=1 Tax=Mytilus coruscus TaxID=42192 RepID=A0A6J8DUH8_MYTCO|nr:unnamed protein product [Mytilus coruscus]
MSFTEDIKCLSDIVFVLPQRVRVVEAVRDLPFASGDILVLELVKNLDLVEGIDRVTKEKIRIPLDYHGKVHRLGKRCNSVAEIHQDKSTWFSVEEPFETPISPWQKKVVKSGSVVELTDIEHEKGIIVRLLDDPVFISEETPLYFKIVLDDEVESLKQIVHDFGLQNIVIKDEYEHPNELFAPGNYILTNILSEEFVLGYRETFPGGQQTHFIIPVSCGLRLILEMSSPNISKPYKNAFFVPKHLYSNDMIAKLYLEYLKTRTRLLEIEEEYVPDIPPRLSKSAVSRQSLMSNQSGASSGPVRPDRRRRTISIQSEDIPKPFERLSSLDETNCASLEEVNDTDLHVIEGSSDGNSEVISPPYMELNKTDRATTHIYDEMAFDEMENTQCAEKTSTSTIRNVLFMCCGKSCEDSDDIHDMAVHRLVKYLNRNQLPTMAEICNKNKLDGAFISELTIEDLMSEPFLQNEEQVDIFVNLVSKQSKNK